MSHFNKKIKVETTTKNITSFAGLVPYINAFNNSYFKNKFESLFDYKKVLRRNGYTFSEKTFSLMQLLLSGGETLKDIGQLNNDDGYKKLLDIKKLPSPNCLSEFLNNIQEADIEIFQEFNIEYALKYYEDNNITSVTWDVDSTLIENDKITAKWTYKDFKGFNPMFLVDYENRKVIAGIFRNGNASPQADIIEIIKKAYSKLNNKSIDITVRSDSAGYRKDLIDFLEEEKIGYTITGDNTADKKSLFNAIPNENWKKYEDGFEIAHTEMGMITSKNKSTSLKIIVKRKLRDQFDLIEGKYIYYYIVTNLTLQSDEEIYKFHQKRAASENIFKELKNDFCLSHLPCSNLDANAFFMQIIICSYNFFHTVKEKLFEKKWHYHTAKTIRYKFIRIAGLVVKKSRQYVLKIYSKTKYIDDLIKALDQSQYALI